MKLSRLEHLLLSTMCEDREPFHALYADSIREIPGLPAQHVIEGLLQLYRLGFAKCYFFNDTTGRYEPRASMSREALLKHCASRTPEELGKWPDESLGGEYFFDITDEGRREEAKEIYAEYYPDAEAVEG